jgi:hypothetical protein
MEKSKIIVGCFELVSFPDLGVHSVMAKVDTGAFSGAINCSRIRVVRRGKDKQRILKFKPLGRGQKSLEYENFEETYIRSATGHRVKRFIIVTKLLVQDREYLIKIGLSNRSNMKSHVLIGRRFLRDNDIIVDVRRNSEYDDEGENTR